MAFGDPIQPQMMQMMPMPQMQKKAAGGGGMQDMGMKLLQAALGQQAKDKAALAAQPAVGATAVPGGPMNITPPTLPGGGGGLGMLGGLLGRLGGGGAGGFAQMLGGGGAMGGGAAGMVPPLTSENALY